MRHMALGAFAPENARTQGLFGIPLHTISDVGLDVLPISREKHIRSLFEMSSIESVALIQLEEK